MGESTREEKYKVQTKKGARNSSVSMHSKVRPAQNIARTGVSNGRSYKADQKSQDSNLSSSGSDTTLAPTPKTTRKNLAKKLSGGMIAFWFTEDVGYSKLPVKRSDDAILRSLNFNETYRSDPYRLLEVKDTYPIASIQILSRRKGVKKTGQGYKVILPAYTKFMLQSVALSSSEKYQLHHTFRSFRISFYDENPEVWNFDGLLINTQNQNWTSEFRVLYKNYLRGTQCAKMAAEVYIGFEDVVVSGLIITMRQQFTATSPNAVPVTFQMIITNEGHSTTESSIVQTLESRTKRVVTANQPAIVFDLVKKSYRSKSVREGGYLTLTRGTADKMIDPDIANYMLNNFPPVSPGTSAA